MKTLRAGLMDNPRRFLTVREAADQVRYTERHVRRWIADGKLPVHRFGRSIRIAQEDLDAFIARRRCVAR
jgi:excisionase family DNA binding protein